MDVSLHDSFDAWKKWVEDAENNWKGTFVKEHINWMIRPEVESKVLHNSDEMPGDTSNPTCIPDAFIFHTVHPTFLVRHPALTFPTLVRTAIDNEGMDALLTDLAEKSMQWEATYHWHVTLYKFLLNSPSYPCTSQNPDIAYTIILDASDLSTPAIVLTYAAAVGLDPEIVKFEWVSTRVEEQQSMGKVEARMKDTLLRSNGLVMEKLKGGENLDLQVEEEKWKSEFGEVLGERVGRMVENAMADHEWLWERRMKV